MRGRVGKSFASALVGLALLLSDVAAAAATGASPKQGPLDRHPSNVAAGRAAVIVGVVILGAVLAVLVRRRAGPSRAADGDSR